VITLVRPHVADALCLQVKRIYVPLPDAAGRKALIQHLMAKQAHRLSDRELTWLSRRTEGTFAHCRWRMHGVRDYLAVVGFSGSDLTALCVEAALGPLRELHDPLNAPASEVCAWPLVVFFW
jgi:SpoVK/Ycf46/Vps4 family AAA+-type ATPase